MPTATAPTRGLQLNPAAPNRNTDRRGPASTASLLVLESRFLSPDCALRPVPGGHADPTSAGRGRFDPGGVCAPIDDPVADNRARVMTVWIVDPVVMDLPQVGA